VLRPYVVACAVTSWSCLRRAKQARSYKDGHGEPCPYTVPGGKCGISLTRSNVCINEIVSDITAEHLTL